MMGSLSGRLDVGRSLVVEVVRFHWWEWLNLEMVGDKLLFGVPSKLGGEGQLL